MNEGNELNFTIDEENLFTLKDENGKDVLLYLLDAVEFEGDQYIVASEVVDGELDELASIFKLNSVGDTDELIGVDDDRIIDEVFAIFVERNSD